MKVVGPGRSRRGGAGARQVRRWRPTRGTTAVTDTYIFALSGGNTEIGATSRRPLGLPAGRLLPLSRQLGAGRPTQPTTIPGDPRKAFRRDARRSPPSFSGITVLWANMDNAISRRENRQRGGIGAHLLRHIPLVAANWRLAACAMFVNVLPVAVMSAGSSARRSGRSTWRRSSSWASRWACAGVDDTSFFVHGYLERGRDAGQRPAGRDPAATAGRRWSATSWSSSLASACCSLSRSLPMRTSADFTAVGLVLAMACDVLVLPFLLLLVADRTKALHHADTMVSNAVSGPVPDADALHAS